MIVAVYHNTVPNAKNIEKVELLKHFSTGVGCNSDTVIDVNNFVTVPSDVGVIQGWVNQGTKTGKHLTLRNSVVEQQLTNSKYVVAVDSNLFLYANLSNPQHYLRYSFNGVFPDTGIYCDSIIDQTRWKRISNNLNISVKNWRSTGDHVLICLQRNGGWSMGGLDVQDWAINIISTIRKYTDRTIIIRPHPGDKVTNSYLNSKHPKCRIKFSKRVILSTNINIVDDLRNCWAAINYNSSPVVGAAIEGIPIFVSNPLKSQCREIANTDLSLIENPVMPDRLPWLERISMFHWNFDELRSGECWSHMKKFIKRRIC
jgi:hypothetical protein